MCGLQGYDRDKTIINTYAPMIHNKQKIRIFIIATNGKLVGTG